MLPQRAGWKEAIVGHHLASPIEAKSPRLRVLAATGILAVLSVPQGPPAASDPVGPVFTDVTVAAGLDYLQDDPSDPRGPTMPIHMSGGAAAGDYDGDGWVDLYVTRLNAPGILFRNRGDGTFEDVTAAAGLAGAPLNGNGAGWVDVDNDGDLDLYVTT